MLRDVLSFLNAAIDCQFEVDTLGCIYKNRKVIIQVSVWEADPVWIAMILKGCLGIEPHAKKIALCQHNDEIEKVLSYDVLPDWETILITGRHYTETCRFGVHSASTSKLSEEERLWIDNEWIEPSQWKRFVNVLE